MRFVVLIVAAIYLALAACSVGSTSNGGTTDGGGTTVSSPAPVDTPTPPGDGVDRSKTIELDGQLYTCGQALQRPDEVCETDVQNAFNQWRDNLIAFVSDPSLATEWGSNYITPEQLAVGGLAACSFRQANNAFGFTQYMKKPEYGDQGKNEAAVSTLYGTAGRVLCPGI